MRRMRSDAACASDLTLDEWSAGELDRDASARVAAHVEGCPHCRARHTSFEALRAEFLAAAPSFERQRRKFEAKPAPSQRVRELRSRQRRWRELGRLAFASVATLSVAAAAVLFFAPLPESSETRTKGSAHVDFFVKHGATVRRGVRGETLAPGDALRFTYTHPTDSYLALFNLDSTSASVYFPASSEAAPVSAGSQVPLDFSVELDAQVGLERVFAMFCPKPFALEPLRAALATNGRLPERPECQLDVISIHKAAPR